MTRIISSSPAKIYFLTALFCIIAVSSNNAAAQNALANVNVVDIPKGYELEIQHITPLRYAGHSPDREGDELEVRLNQSLPIQYEDDEALLNWASAFGVPVGEIRMEGLTTETPRLFVEFTKDVKFAVKNTRDNRITIITIETDRPPMKGPVRQRDDSATNLVTALIPLDPDMESLLNRGNDHMLDKDYRRAVQVFISVREKGNDDIQAPIQELIGLTREYLGQNAQARAEYEEYLEKFPEGEAAPRVRQRYNALITAASAPKEQRKEVAQRGSGEEWQTRTYGAFSQRYYYNSFTNGDGETLARRSALNNYLNLTARAENSHYDLRATVSGAYQLDFEFDGDEEVINPHQITVEGRQKDLGIFARLGRQTRSSGGVLGRFDGVHVSYEAHPAVTVNTVFGYPVLAYYPDYVNTDQQFYGASVDVGTLWDGWDFSGFYIRQDYLDIKDREAIGGEVRYFDQQKNFFASVDYDVAFDHLNIVNLRGRWAFDDKTAVTGSFNYRSNPILISAGALQNRGTISDGQVVRYFEDLFRYYSLQQVYNFVSANIYSYATTSAGVSHILNERWRFDSDLTISDFSGTNGLGEIEDDFFVQALPDTGIETYLSMRATTNRLFFADDATIFSVNMALTDVATTYSSQINWRWRINDKFRFNPRAQFEMRERENGSTRTATRYKFRLDYKLRRDMRLEMDLGYDWQQEKETIFNLDVQTVGLFVSAGYRWQF